MDVQAVMDFIASVGFPAAMCIIMLQNNKEFSQTVAENTRVIQALADRIDNIINHKGGD